MAESDSPNNNQTSFTFRYRDFLALRHWPTLFGVGLLRLMAFLPMPLLSIIGYIIGAVCYCILIPRRKIALKNIALCFPELTDKKRKHINFKHYCYSVKPS